MHLYNDMSIDVLGYLTPPPFGDLNLDEALRTLRPTMTLRGNIDQVEFMMKASPAQVGKRVGELLEKVGEQGAVHPVHNRLLLRRNPVRQHKGVCGCSGSLCACA